MPLVGFILIAMALFAVGGTLFMVMREHQEAEEWYVPPKADSTPATTPVVEPPAQPGTTSVPTPAPPPAPAATPDTSETKAE